MEGGFYPVCLSRFWHKGVRVIPRSGKGRMGFLKNDKSKVGIGRTSDLELTFLKRRVAEKRKRNAEKSDNSLCEFYPTLRPCVEIMCRTDSPVLFVIPDAAPA